MKNIALIGMPGCGKSTVGQLLAAQLAYTFVDTDALVVQDCGMSIPALFETKGEAFFRDAEAHAIAIAAALTDVVIATGGGAVLRERNMAVLAQSCELIYLNRSCQDILQTGNLQGRPLLAGGATKLYELYEQRHALYERYASITITNTTTPQQAVAAIMEAIRCDF